MKQFLETIRVENGEFVHLNKHLARLQQTISFFYGKNVELAEREIQVPENFSKGLVKCRIIYSDSIEKIEFQSYQKRPIKRLKIVYDNTIDYAYKSTDREMINQLYLQKGDADEIIIVKDGFVTDSSFSNLLFENEKGLFTPTTYLLNGIQRQFLLEKKIIRECPIKEENIYRYSRIHLINAMLLPGDIVIDIVENEK